MADSVARQLLDAPAMRLVAKVGQHDDIGNLADPPKRLDRARNRRLAMHFLPKKLVQ